MDEPIDMPFVVSIARQILDHHARGGTCQRCTPADCDQTQWALVQIAANHARRAADPLRTAPTVNPGA